MNIGFSTSRGWRSSQDRKNCFHIIGQTSMESRIIFRDLFRMDDSFTHHEINRFEAICFER
jgi:hypothetical protein